MARQITDLDEIFSNELAEQDYLLVRDTSSRVDKKVTVEALRSAFLSVLGELSGKDKIANEDLDSDSFLGVSYLTIGDLLIQYGTVNASSIAGTTSASVSVTFEKTFADNTFTALASPQFNESSSSLWWAFVKQKSSTGLSVDAGYTSIAGTGGGRTSACVIQWIAIGKRGDW